MSNDDNTTPRGHRDESETGLGRLGGGDDTASDSTPPLGVPTDATQAMPQTPPPPAAPGAFDSTIAMPASGAPTPGSDPFGAGAGAAGAGVGAAAVPPSAPGGAATTTIPLDDPPPEWYRQPGVLAGVLLGLLALGALGAFLVLSGGGDDDDVFGDLDELPVSMVINRVDAAGNPLNTTLAADVTLAGSGQIEWISPIEVTAGDPARVASDSSGRVEFRWAVIGASGSDAAASVQLSEFVAGVPGTGDFVDQVVGQCLLERDGATNDLSVDAELVADDTNDSTIQAGLYTFPNARFGPGDRVTCTLSDIAPGSPTPTTVPPESTAIPETTIPETTVVETTVPETTVPETTVPETTVAETTTTTAPPAPEPEPEPEPEAPTLGEALAANPRLSQSLELLDRVGLLDELETADQPFTLFVPDNDAIDDLRADPDGPDLDDNEVVRELFEIHLVSGVALTAEQILSADEVDVDNGGPQPVDADVDPPAIGGQAVFEVDLEVDGGIVHVVLGAFTLIEE